MACMQAHVEQQQGFELLVAASPPAGHILGPYIPEHLSDILTPASPGDKVLCCELHNLQGFVVSDCGAVSDVAAGHKIAANISHAGGCLLYLLCLCMNLLLTCHKVGRTRGNQRHCLTVPFPTSNVLAGPAASMLHHLEKSLTLPLCI
jgi:hypothetical protein